MTNLAPVGRAGIAQAERPLFGAWRKRFVGMTSALALALIWSFSIVKHVLSDVLCGRLLRDYSRIVLAAHDVFSARDTGAWDATDYQHCNVVVQVRSLCNMPTESHCRSLEQLEDSRSVARIKLFLW